MRKPRKVTKRRGSRRHGYGSEHRGSGSRGGAGNAGSGKRAQSKKPSYWGIPTGKQGFTTQTPKQKVINIGDIDKIIETWVQEGKAEKNNQQYTINLEKTGYDKVLGKGNTTKQILLKGKATEHAKKKIELAKGKVE
ncbi:uL15 family ribosomal protein [Candidatus Woesearchaeota archaeon]|nr:uL15 family ribosomal protein [Candidatus Woesearchaeota archaeon]